MVELSSRAISLTSYWIAARARTRHALSIGTIAVTTILPLRVSWAQPSVLSESERRELAISLFNRGKSMFGLGRCKEALPDYEASLALEPAPPVLLQMAQCHLQLNQILRAREEYKGVLKLIDRARERNPQNQLIEQALDERNKKLEYINKIIPRIHLTLNPLPSLAQATIIRGESQNVEALNEKLKTIEVDPGSYKIIVEAPGYISQTLEVVAEKEKNHELNVALKREPPPDPPVNIKKVLGYTAGIIGASTTIIGIGFGISAITKRQESDDNCHGGLCNAGGWDVYTTGQRHATVANVTLGVGLPLTAIGTVLVLTAKTQVADPPAAAQEGLSIGVTDALGSSGARITITGIW